MAERRSPLAGWAERLGAAAVHSGGSLSLRELAAGQLNLRLDPAHAPDLGVALPVAPNTTAAADGITVLWLGPDEWLALAPIDGTDDLLARWRAALRGHAHSLVDVSAQSTMLAIGGNGAAGVLAHGCALDLERDLGAGRCAQTLLARARVTLWRAGLNDGARRSRPNDGARRSRPNDGARRSRPDEIRLLVRASFAPYLAAWLLDAASERLVPEPTRR